MPATEQTPLVSGTRRSKSSGWQRASEAARGIAQEKLRARRDRGSMSYRKYCYSMMRSHSHSLRARVFRSIIVVLIVVNIITFVLDSDKHIHERYIGTFNVIEGVTSCVFMAEYCLRVWTIPESRRYRGSDPHVARMQFIFSLGSAIDLIAILPWFIERFALCVCVIGGRGCDVQLPNFSFLRLFRLFRLLKAQPVLSAFDVVARVVYYNAEILLVALLICLVMILITSTLLFYLAPPGDSHDDFSSIPATMYLSVMMLTGQGQPEGTLPWYTKLIVICTSIFSVAQFAIPASMLTWGFEQEAQRRIKKNLEMQREQEDRVRRGLPRFAESSSSSDPNSDSSWEEYERIAAAADESDTEDDEEASKRGAKAPARGDGAGAGGPGRKTETRPAVPLAVGRAGSAGPAGDESLPKLPLESVSAAPELLMQVAAQLTELHREVARLRERNEALEAENARLRG